MGLMCRAAGHRANEAEARWNEGWFFTGCARCGADLFRGEGAWVPVPRGHRIAWRTGYHRHSLPSDWGRNMPVAAGPVRHLQPGVLRRMFWRRQLALPRPGVDDTRGDVTRAHGALMLAAIALLGFGLPWLRPRAR